ncbi:DUF2157 domain-containing protein [Pseudalkalibacillus salsuginis]|uniref:DUF2157 domain-containing protein n=1 Tax=Pseudalkalibacillus salsuginis TaxID=2910972 RepID=UPI001F169605|nr:DUF2157 domain-containing protein [Pseudalkalibacillus salsuginis]MCF6410088.1 DUF2157 domain-containing protein [Pseudalkalibacillus salsuginis]
MEFSREERRRIFIKEISLLKKEEYITEKEFECLLNAHNDYYAAVIASEQQHHETIVTKDEKTPPPVEPAKTTKVKKKLTLEEIRERNITWSLNLGVILLLIGGLFVATSNWETMSDWMKSGSIILVSGLFYGLAFITKRILKIDKTAFAFIVLGSLFLPIFILSIGWFGLFGPYLSVYGQGRYILGLIGSLLLIPIYGLLARGLSSRLFVWFSYITLSICIGFLLASFSLPVDGFYMGIMLYNGLLLVIYHWLKKREVLKLFFNELVYFSQINLVFSTLLMLFFYESNTFYSFNLLLTAILYLSMIYVSRQKEYHFIFSTMIVYGAYQLIENSFLETFSALFYALLGIIFLVVPRFLDEQFPLKKAFHLTSAAVSGFAFLYISYEGILLKMNEPSYLLMLAYLIIAGNFIYLSNVTKVRLFTYLIPVFLAASLYEVALKMDQWIQFDTFLLPAFFIGFILLICFGYIINLRLLQVIRNSSKDVGIGIMLFAIIANSTFDHSWELGIQFLFLAISSFIVMVSDNHIIYKKTAPWVLPFSLGFAFIAFGEELRRASIFYYTEFGISMDFVLGSLVLILSYFTWKSIGRNSLALNSFFFAQGFYTLGILTALTLPINETLVRPIVLLAGIGVYFALYKVTTFKWVSFLIGMTILVWYFTLVCASHLTLDYTSFMESIQLTLGGVFLLMITVLIRKSDNILSNGLVWVAHCYFPFALLSTYIYYNERSLWSFIVAVGIYAVSTYMIHTEWKIKTLLYGTFTTLFMTVFVFLETFQYEDKVPYAFLFTSLLIVFFWGSTNKFYKKRTSYYLVPFSIFGIGSFLMVNPYGWLTFILTVTFSVGLLIFLHKVKWDLVASLPLLLILIGTAQFLEMSDLESSFKILLAAGIAIGLLLSGQFIYKSIYKMEYGRLKQFDSYTIVAFIFFGYLYTLQHDLIGMKALPGILISIGFWIQRNRVPSSWFKFVVFLSGAYLLQPYYALVNAISLPPLWKQEIYDLPWIILVVFLRRCMEGKYKSITSQIQWAVLLIVSVLLIKDGLESSTIYDALILGSLSLLSMLTGMFKRIKSYFFIGAGVLLLNVILQTRPFWGNLPWWGYLLITGSLLIFVASYNEWHKQKTSKGKLTILTLFKEKVIKKIARWD